MASAHETRKATDSRSGKDGETATEATGEIRKIGERSLDAAEDATKTAANTAQEAASQGRETMAKGMRTMADASAPLVEASYGEGRRLVETSAHITDLYRDATSRTAEDMQALTTTYSHLGLGLVRMQQAYLNALQQSFARARRQPHDLLRCKSMTEFAEVQRDLYTDGVAFMVDSSTALLRLAGEVVQSAAEPLEGRTGEQRH